MRQRQGIAGATLIYGKQPDPPDLLLASQFLIDDLRRDGRTISGVRVSRHALRLRADGFELALTLTDRRLPMHAFSGVVRPRPDDADSPDLMRGRVLHALRHHRWVLGVLMRLRGVQEGQGVAMRQQALPGACHALTGAVAEAAPPMLVIWQANGLLCTASEFLRLPADFLELPADRLAPVGRLHPGRAPLARPDPNGAAGRDRVTPRPVIAASREQPADDADVGSARQRDTLPGALALVAPGTAGIGAESPVEGTGRRPAPASRAARLKRQSGGRLFGRRSHEGRVVMAASAGLAGQNAQLAGALRHARPHAAMPGGPPLQRRAATGLRIVGVCLALALFGASANGADPDGMAARGALPSAMAQDRALPAP